MFFSKEPVIGGASDTRLTITGTGPHDYKITYGDRELHGIRSLTLNIDSDSLPEVTIVLRPDGIEVDAETYASFEAVFDRKVGVTEKELRG